jgi:hypothetical protein
MKKQNHINQHRILAVAICLLMVLCTGCGNSVQDSAEYLPDEDFPIEYAVWGGNTEMVETDSGFYFLAGDFLFYTDKESMTTVPLCSKTDCLHENETDPYKVADCDAFFSYAGIQYIQYYEGRIYLLCGESTSNDIVLLSMDATGSDRKEIYSFKSAPTSIAIHRGYVYYNTSVYNADGKKTYGIAAISLKNPSKDPITVYAGTFSDGSVDEIRPYRNWVYFRECGTDEDGEYSNWKYAYCPANQQLICLTEPVEQDDVQYYVSLAGFREGKLLLSWQYKEGENYYHRWWWADLDGTLLEECTAIPADFNGKLYLDDDYFYLYDTHLDEGEQYYIHMLDKDVTPCLICR